MISKYSFNNMNIGLLLINYLISNTSVNQGRTGGTLIVTAFLGISRLITPRDKSKIKVQNEIFEDEEVKEKRILSNNQIKSFLFWLIVFGLTCSFEYLYCCQVLMKLGSYIKINSLLLTFIQMGAIQILDFMNGKLIEMLTGVFLESFYVMPFKIISAFIIYHLQLVIFNRLFFLH